MYSKYTNVFGKYRYDMKSRHALSCMQDQIMKIFENRVNLAFYALQFEMLLNTLFEQMRVESLFLNEVICFHFCRWQWQIFQS